MLRRTSQTYPDGVLGLQKKIENMSFYEDF